MPCGTPCLASRAECALVEPSAVFSAPSRVALSDVRADRANGTVELVCDPSGPSIAVEDRDVLPREVPEPETEAVQAEVERCFPAARTLRWDWDATRQRLQQEFGHAVALEIEPGRFLVAEAGYLIAEIRAIKRMGENIFYLLDAGFNNLARPILYGSYHPMSIVPADDDPDSTQLQDVVVGGPLCESGDIFTQQEGGFVAQRSLPVARVGQLLVIECAGAYGHVMSSNYNSKPFAAEVMIRDHKVQMIRERQTFADLIRGEVIPKS